MAETTLLEAIRQALDEEMARDESILLIGNDVGPRGGVFQATQGLRQKYGPERVIDAPLAEAAMVGVGIGAALYGQRPVVEIQFADFIHPAFNQIVSEAARMHYRSNGAWNVPLVIRAPYGGGIGGGLYYSQSIEGFFARVPGLKVVLPSNPYDAKGLLKAAIRDPNPVLFLEPKQGYRSLQGKIPKDDYTVPIGKAKITRLGERASLLAYGMMHALALEAAGSLAEEDISVEVIDLRTLYPVDRETILASVKKTNRALILYEDNLTGGYGAEIAALIAEHAFASLDAPVRRLAAPDVPAAPYSAALEKAFMPTTERITKALRELASY
jgi:2-oxoisovalerate dehydrogenase E1 component beta subunit